MKRLFLVFTGLLMATIPMTALGQGQTSQETSAPSTNAGANPLNLPVGRYAVINTGAFTAQNGIEQLRQQINRVNDQFKDRNAEFQALQQRADSLQREVQTQGANLTPQALAAKQEEMEDLQLDIQRKKEDLERDYNKALRDATDPVVERINSFLENYARQNNITMVLEAGVLFQARGLAYVHPELDITKPFMEAYNAANPVSGARPNSSGANR